MSIYMSLPAGSRPAAPPLPDRGKNIVICADGTGNTTIKGRGTNVFKLYEAIDQNGHRTDPGLTPQVALYHDGVGTENVKWWRILTGATGFGLSRNVKQLYEELARVYAPGDRIYLFGFSRGAFTVRTLAGLVALCGIPDLSKYPTNEALKKGVAQAYGEYRRKYASWLTRLISPPTVWDAEAIAALRRRFSVRIPHFDPAGREEGKLIAFMGVWDTVDAVGLPLRVARFWNRVIYAFKFPDRTLTEHVERACHALAIDEQRESFEPVLWDESRTAHPERIEQVWFAGVHSNVGGGYPRQGMSLVSLDWIMTRAEAAGLRFIPSERQYYQSHADAHDRMYDSRAGLGMLYRWKPRNVRLLCEANGVAPKVHRSVFERIARSTGGYAPGSVPPDCEAISTTAPAPGATIDVLRTLVRDHHAGPASLLERAAGTLSVGRWAYWSFFWSVMLMVLCTIGGIGAEAVRAGGGPTALVGGAGWRAAAGYAADGVLGAGWIGLALRALWSRPWLIASTILSIVLALTVDARLDRRYSEFWHGLRLDMRNAMGLGSRHVAGR
jgi:uncharacterized protein (DUF2235 family)